MKEVFANIENSKLIASDIVNEVYKKQVISFDNRTFIVSSFIKDAFDEMGIENEPKDIEDQESKEHNFINTNFLANVKVGDYLKIELDKIKTLNRISNYISNEYKVTSIILFDNNSGSQVIPMNNGSINGLFYRWELTQTGSYIIKVILEHEGKDKSYEPVVYNLNEIDYEVRTLHTGDLITLDLNEYLNLQELEMNGTSVNAIAKIDGSKIITSLENNGHYSWYVIPFGIVEIKVYTQDLYGNSNTILEYRLYSDSIYYPQTILYSFSVEASSK